MRRLALPLIAVVLVALVLGVQVAAGGGNYVPRRPANPCTPRPVPPIPAQLEPLAQEIVLLGRVQAQPPTLQTGRVRGRYFRENFAQGGLELVQTIPELVTNATRRGARTDGFV